MQRQCWCTETCSNQIGHFCVCTSIRSEAQFGNFAKGQLYDGKRTPLRAMYEDQIQSYKNTFPQHFSSSQKCAWLSHVTKSRKIFALNLAAPTLPIWRGDKTSFILLKEVLFLSVAQMVGFSFLRHGAQIQAICFNWISRGAQGAIRCSSTWQGK